MQVEQITIASIWLDERNWYTSIDYAHVQELANKITTEGLAQPILVGGQLGHPYKGQYWLIAGRHRLLACQSLGWETIPAIVKPELNDIHKRDQVQRLRLTENLTRKELRYIERAMHALELDRLYRIEHESMLMPEGRPSKTCAKMADVSYKDRLQALSDALKQTSGATEKDILCAQNTTKEVYKLLCSSHWGNHKQTCLKLSREHKNPELQLKIAKVLCAPASQYHSFQDAKDALLKTPEKIAKPVATTYCDKLKKLHDKNKTAGVQTVQQIMGHPDFRAIAYQWMQAKGFIEESNDRLQKRIVALEEELEERKRLTEHFAGQDRLTKRSLHKHRIQ